MSQTTQPLPGPQAVPAGAQPNPAFAQWMQQYQQQQAIVAENAKRQAQFDAACKLIREDGVRGFKLDIESDSTIAPDEQAEQQARISFMQQFVPFMQQIAPLAQGNPDMANLAGEAAMFVMRGFPVARTLEEAVEKAFKVLGTMPPVPPKGASSAPQADPQLEQARLMAEVHDTQTQAQTAQQDTQAKTQTAQAVASAKSQTDIQTATLKAQTDQMAIAQRAQQAADQSQLKREQMALDAAQARAKFIQDAEKIASAERTAKARQTSQSAGRLT